MFTTFADYQAQYETSFLMEGINRGLDALRVRIHHLVTFVDEAIRVPGLIIKTAQLSITIFSYFPALDPSLEVPKQLCKEAKNFTNFFKGWKSVDGLLNFQFSWKKIILNGSGMTLFVLSTITLIERFHLRDVSMIKTRLAAIPLFGVLPYGGLLPVSFVGLMSIIFLVSLDKKRKLEKNAAYIENEKLSFWSNSLDLNKIRVRLEKCRDKSERLREGVNVYAELIKEGREIEEGLNSSVNQNHQMRACRKALDELETKHEEKQILFDKCNKNTCEWIYLETSRSTIEPHELENFRQAKEAKWKTKLEKIENEKRTVQLSIITIIIVIAKNSFAIGAVLSGYGAVSLPWLANLSLDVIGTTCSIVNFFMKRSIQKMEILAVDLEEYV
jgi:hypothetical protein